VELQQARTPGHTFATLLPIPTSAYPTPAARPPNSRMDCSKLHRTFGWTMMDWQDSLAAVIAELPA
jgi:dTDP-4-dehydrorhamnose reductase